MKFCDFKKGEKVVCACGTPLFRIIADKILRFVKSSKRETVYMDAQYSGGQFRIKCGKCGGNFAFIDLDDSFQIGDEVAVIKVPI